jgi:hypothetical protein
LQTFEGVIEKLSSLPCYQYLDWGVGCQREKEIRRLTLQDNFKTKDVTYLDQTTAFDALQ